MAHVPKTFYRATAAGTVTVPVKTRWIVTSVVLANIHATASQTVRLDLAGVPLVPTTNLLPGAVYTLDCAQVLDAGTVVAVTTSAAGVIATHVSGVESDV